MPAAYPRCTHNDLGSDPVGRYHETRTGLNSQPMAVPLTRTEELVPAILHSTPGDLPAAGCRVPLEFHIPADARSLHAVWRNVEARAVRIDDTPDPLPLRLWFRSDGNLDHEVREAGVKAPDAALNPAVARGTMNTRRGADTCAGYGVPRSAPVSGSVILSCPV